MAKTEPDYEAFQDYVWSKLPQRKILVGKESVCDCLAIVVQEFPDAQMAQSDAGGDNQRELIKGLVADVRRHLHLAYGDQKFGMIWTIILQALIYQMVVIIIDWWRKKKANRMAMLKWRGRWRDVSGDE